MFHSNRQWVVGDPIDDPEELARKLTDHTWCPCNGFRCHGYLFLNDSTSSDGVAEFGVLKSTKGGKYYFQIESITFGWCSFEKAKEYITNAIRGEFDGFDVLDVVDGYRIHTPAVHGKCGWCA